MESKFQRNIFEAGFDSFEFDDGFLMKVDSDLKKNKINEKKFDSLKGSSKETEKSDHTLKKDEKKTFDIKAHCYDLPLFIEDFNESDFFESSKKKSRNNSQKIIKSVKKEDKKEILYNGSKNCLSPIQGPNLSEKVKLFSSTPLKSDDDPGIKKKLENFQKKKENEDRPSDFDYLEADLFDDWDVNEINRELESKVERDTVTFSQALKLIEEAESAMEAQKESLLNRSVDLLTGEIIGADVENMFEESFDLPQSQEEPNKESSTDSVIFLENFERGSKPPAAQKLIFESEKNNDDRLSLSKESNLKSICFNSDDDFDFITQDLLKKPKKVFKCSKSNMRSQNISKTENSTLNDCDLNESIDAVVGVKKKGKNFNVIESDTTEDSSSPKFFKPSTLKCKKRHFQENCGREFIDSEAEVSDEIEVSSDEAEEDGEYDKSFLDEGSYFTQNCSADMTAKYLESVKGVNRFGGFKIPAAKSYDPNNVFSQIPENNTDYEIDSFCVNEVEDEIKTDLSDLEVAEKILEMDRKKRKKKRSQKLRKFK